jgi:hypothetical protein
VGTRELLQWRYRILINIPSGSNKDGSIMIWTVSNLTKILQQSELSLRFHLKNVFDSRSDSLKTAIIAHAKRFAADVLHVYFVFEIG